MSDIPPIDIRPDHWVIVRDILRARMPGCEVWAFGSRAKGKAKPWSDLDLAIVAERPFPALMIAALAEDFADSDLPWKVDVVDRAAARPSFQAIIDRDKVPVQRG